MHSRIVGQNATAAWDNLQRLNLQGLDLQSPDLQNSPPGTHGAQHDTVEVKQASAPLVQDPPTAASVVAPPVEQPASPRVQDGPGAPPPATAILEHGTGRLPGLPVHIADPLSVPEIKEAFEVLRQRLGAPSVEQSIALMRHPNALVRCKVIMDDGYDDIAEPTGPLYEAVVGALADPDPRVRAHATFSLVAGFAPPNPGIARVLNMLCEDPSMEVRVAAAFALLRGRDDDDSNAPMRTLLSSRLARMSDDEWQRCALAILVLSKGNGLEEELGRHVRNSFAYLPGNWDGRVSALESLLESAEDGNDSDSP